MANYPSGYWAFGFPGPPAPVRSFDLAHLIPRFEAAPAPTPPEQITCGGLNDERINEFARSSDLTRAYLDSTFCYLKDQWRSRSCSFMCLRDASSRALPDGWKNRHGAPTCSQCLASVHNLRKDYFSISWILGVRGFRKRNLRRSSRLASDK